MMRYAMLLGFAMLAACASTPSDSVALLDTEWQVTEIGTSTLTEDASAEPLTLLMSAESASAAGSGGCNRYSAKFTHKDQSLRFSAPMASKKGCAAHINQQEAAFFQALRTVATQRIDGNQLQLLDAEGRVLVRLRAKPL